MRNVEIKAELRDAQIARAVCRSLRGVHARTFHQTDTYYQMPKGRLKKREVEGEPTEYIFYERPNQSSAKVSTFSIFTERQAESRFGKDPLPEWVRVRKRRELWLVGYTRVHLDRVDGLGDFLELESLVSRANTLNRARAHIAALLEEFRPVLGELIDRGYADMLAMDHEQTGGTKLLPPGR
jgi:adenylate cyclase class IV